MSKILQVEHLVQEFNLTKDFLDKVKFKKGRFSLENQTGRDTLMITYNALFVISDTASIVIAKPHLTNLIKCLYQLPYDQCPTVCQYEQQDLEGHGDRRRR